jgi:hypothetical protein
MRKGAQNYRILIHYVFPVLTSLRVRVLPAAAQPHGTALWASGGSTIICTEL